MPRFIEGRFVDVGGIKTYYIEKGKGRDLVLLHGGGIGIDSKLTWLRNIDVLSSHFHVIAFDQVGFGKSDMPNDRTSFSRLARAKHALRFLNFLKIRRAILVGHSEGGFIATWLAVQRPLTITKLVIVASGSTAPRLGQHRDEKWLRAAKDAYNWELEASSEENYIENFKQHMLFNPQKLNDRLLRANYRQARQAGNLQLYLNLPPEEADPDIYYSMQEKYIFPYLPNMKVPTLLVWASDDATVPVERGLRLMEMIPNAAMHIFNKAKHLVMIDRPDEFNSLLKSFCSAP